MVSTQDTVTPRRTWFAIASATIVLLVSYWSIVLAFVAGNVEGGPRAVGPLALGLALMPFVFLVLAFLSGHRRAPGAVVRALGLVLLIGVPLVLVNLVFGLVAGFGSGGIMTLRAEKHHRMRARWMAVAVAATYVLLLMFVAPEVGLLTGGFIPFLAVGFADSVVEWKAGVR
ncbi:MAG: hypothetical protein ACE5E8_04280 [Acidimicrobiia bacterium]